MPGHFQVYTSTPADTAHGVKEINWRLLSENGRSLAQSCTVFPSWDEAVANVAVVQLAAVAGTILMTEPDRIGWGWALLDPRQAPLSWSARRYARKAECAEAIRRFRDLAPVSRLTPRLAVFRRDHRLQYVVA